MSSWPSRVRITGFILAILLGSTWTPVRAVPSYNGVDPSIAAPVSVGRCATTESLDCIVSINVIRADGSVLIGQSQDVPCLAVPKPQGTVGRAKRQCQPPFDEGQWNINLPDGSGQTFLVGDEFDTPAWHQTPQTALAGFHIGVRDAPFLNVTDQVEFKIRTSWLIPTGITGYGRNAAISVTNLPNGHLMTLKASIASVAIMSQGARLYEMSKDPTKFSADKITRQISFNVGDVNAVTGINSVKSTCQSGTNFDWQMSDIQTFTPPEIDRSGNIVIQIAGPHYLMDQKALNIGTYEADVQVGPNACTFRNSSLIGAQSYSITVLDQDGTPEVTTNSITVDANNVAHFRINGIHFSQPTITIKGLRTNSGKKITCVSGKITQIIQGDQPTCPKGFSQKK